MCVAEYLSHTYGVRLSENMTGYPHLLELGLHMNNIGEEGCNALCDALSTYASPLTDLSIYGNLPGTFWGTHCANMLRCNNSLLVLDLGGNGIGDEGAISLAGALGGHGQGSDGCNGSERSSINANTNCSLTDLHLDHCCIGQAGAEALHGMLAANTSLTSLWMHGNHPQSAEAVRNMQTAVA